MHDHIAIQEQDFSLTQEYQALREANLQDGAIVTFSGTVRDLNQGKRIQSLTLEHYPAMTLKCLQQIVAEARNRWQLGRVRIIHRVGRLALGDQIVFVGVSSRHRGDAFAACEFIMDYLKTRAPFWKKEQTGNGEHWVEAKAEDQRKADAWK
ncbi:molybdopterin synthase catalytic subunit MoaE [Aliiglaciecola sp. CAU 1673]|uniref:molybdopterin synthase catalytic subunit MoaE n=1 Tax=Aliiglaciecola sp. CAU 1673 TaxID=3032595 RepID=UPI0023DBDD90|nr:molybdopterin synthase catalytic subunit MoaE [Aliiglaciecola sp. CAU 1673]MDF2177394.1 molybdopterin synthase catalytic subunit MoaE [Aliiglaciecola sp. CAU 1673]